MAAPAAFPRRGSPSAPYNTHFGPFFVCWANFFALAPTSGRAGRRMSRTRRDNMATLKPTTSLHTPNKDTLKPPSPLHPKSAPKTPFSTRKGDKGFRQPSHLADRARPQCPRALKSCLAPPFHTWSLSPARGPDGMHAGNAAQAHVEGFTCVSRGERACSGAYVRTTLHDRHRCAQNTDHLAHSHPFSPFFPRWSALWALHQPKPRSDFHQTGEMASLEPRHAGDTPTVSF